MTELGQGLLHGAADGDFTEVEVEGDERRGDVRADPRHHGLDRAQAQGLRGLGTLAASPVEPCDVVRALEFAPTAREDRGAASG